MQKVNEQRIYANYNRKAKFLGLIDYNSLIVLIIYIIIVLTILRFLPFDLDILIYIFLVLVIPVVSVFCININNESTLDVILVIINFFINKKYFVKMEYTKDYQSNSFKI